MHTHVHDIYTHTILIYIYIVDINIHIHIRIYIYTGVYIYICAECASANRRVRTYIQYWVRTARPASWRSQRAGDHMCIQVYLIMGNAYI